MPYIPNWVKLSWLLTLLLSACNNHTEDSNLNSEIETSKIINVPYNSSVQLNSVSQTQTFLFDLDTSKNISITLKAYHDSEFDLYLGDDENDFENSTHLAFSENTGSLESINTFLDEGTYYITVFVASGSSDLILSIVDEPDTDGDGIANHIDEDDDNDGILDTEDDYPVVINDLDNDGLNNEMDDDDDGDGVLDVDDTFPLDASIYNAPPVISIADSHLIIKDGSSFDLSSSASDIEQDTLTFLWNLNNQQFSQQVVNNIVLDIGSYEATLQVNDGVNTVSASVFIEVINKQPPNIIMDSYQEVKTLDAVSLVASDSFDSDGNILSFLWTQPIEQNLELTGIEQAILNFKAPESRGVYSLLLTVTDDDNLISSSEVWINVCDETGCGKSPTLNDTGIVTCSNDLMNSLACPESDFEGQDAEFGRDNANTLIKIGAGKAGFDFTKLDNNGDVLDQSAQQWSCVLDNLTGLIWEVKSTESGLHDSSSLYSWYSTDNLNNYNEPGIQNGGSCFESDCDTQSFKDAVNQKTLCGYDDWTLPTRAQLLSIIDFSVYSPVIDTNYFPNTASNHYWTSTSNSGDTTKAFHVNFKGGVSSSFEKTENLSVRLVRTKK